MFSNVLYVFIKISLVKKYYFNVRNKCLNSDHGLNNELLVPYSGHGLTNKLLSGIWIVNKRKFVIQMFPLYRCSLFRSPMY